MASIFSKIVKGEIPCYKVAENDRFLAFLDINPMTFGHTLVIPKKEIDYIFDLDDDLYQDLFLFAKSVANALEKNVSCERVAIAVVGLEVPHAHIHLMPINSMEDFGFQKNKLEFTTTEMKSLAASIMNTHLS